jgi:hypothetical protein
MKNLLYAATLGMLLMAAPACSPTMNVTTDYNKSTNFTQFKSYSFKRFETQQNTISELNRDRIIKAVKAELNKKGMTENDQSPDVFVNVVAMFKNKTEVTGYSDYYGYGGVYRPYMYGPGFSTTQVEVNDYKDGSLFVDIVQASDSKLVWEGIGNSRIDGPVKDPDTAIPAAIAKIMAGYPPAAKK